MRQFSLSGLVVILMVLGGSTSISYKQDQIQYQVISALDFRAAYTGRLQSTTTVNHVFSSYDDGFGTIIIDLLGYDSSSLFASLNLPDGAQVREVSFYYRDCNLSANRPMLFIVSATSPLTDTFESFGGDHSIPILNGCDQSQTLRAVTAITVTPFIIDNSQYRYMLEFIPQVSGGNPPTQFFYGARVGYTLQATYPPAVYLPSIAR